MYYWNGLRTNTPSYSRPWARSSEHRATQLVRLGSVDTTSHCACACQLQTAERLRPGGPGFAPVPRPYLYSLA
jgi:hypothetical protein